MSEVSNEKIPNNVNLSGDRRLQRALENWLPNYINWWKDMGPEGFQTNDVFLRTAISVDRDGWANFDYVKMPDYRWGIFLADAVPDRKIGFGDHANDLAWQEVPGEYRNVLRRIIVTQGDTEPASVEQQRLLGQTAPSLYDMRNLFQVNVEEGRHLWAMVYLLQSHFGRDGREEAEMLLERRSGDADKPRILGAFNAPMTDWLSFFMFTSFTDRDGKYQLLSLAESGFDPLARTCKFMLTEEAHHMFVGETGIQRVIQRACEMLKADGGDVREQGGVPFDMIQRALNHWYTLSLDLFGSEISSNAATYFAAGIKGRAYETKRTDDHVLLDQVMNMDVVRDNKLVTEEVALRNALNEVLRDDYTADNQKAVDRWNKVLRDNDVSDFEFKLPSQRFNRAIGEYANFNFDPEGNLISKEAFDAKKDDWVMSKEDIEYLKSIQDQVIEPGKMANWIAAPKTGIKGRPTDYEYVKL